jgi:hypothetical protein
MSYRQYCAPFFIILHYNLRPKISINYFKIMIEIYFHFFRIESTYFILNSLCIIIILNAYEILKIIDVELEINFMRKK